MLNQVVNMLTWVVRVSAKVVRILNWVTKMLTLDLTVSTHEC